MNRPERLPVGALKAQGARQVGRLAACGPFEGEGWAR